MCVTKSCRLQGDAFARPKLHAKTRMKKERQKLEIRDENTHSFDKTRT